jgi:hypothetical protein
VNGNTIKLEAIQSGKISYLEPGEDIVFPDGPSRPSGAFAEFHKILLRNICLGLGIPYSFAVDPSAMSGPTARLEMQQAGRTFRRYQKLLDDKVLRPIKNIVIADAVSRGLIENNVGSRTTKGIFNFGANVSIDLGRESQANISEFRCGLTTASQIYSERGLDFESAMRQRAIEAKLIKDLAEKYGVAPETISDIVTPTPPQPLPPIAPAPKPVAPANDEPEEGEDEGGDQKPIPEDPIDPSSEELQAKEKKTELDCGTGAGGFQPGNSCAGEGSPSNYKADSDGNIATNKIFKNKEEAFPKYKDEKPEVIEVSSSKIIPTQKSVEQKTINDYAKGEGNFQDYPEVVKRGENYIITDGHHRIAQQIISGKTKIRVRKVGIAESENSEDKKKVLESLDPASIKMLIEGMMGGIELAKYDGIDFTPPEGAREAAKRALDVREGKPASQRGMTPVGIARARDLQNGVKMSPDTVRRMKAFFDRHEVDKKGATWDEQGKGWQAWNGWGGDAGYSWARKVVRQMNAIDKKT